MKARSSCHLNTTLRACKGRRSSTFSGRRRSPWRGESSQTSNPRGSISKSWNRWDRNSCLSPSLFVFGGRRTYSRACLSHFGLVDQKEGPRLGSGASESAFRVGVVFTPTLGVIHPSFPLRGRRDRIAKSGEQAPSPRSPLFSSRHVKRTHAPH
jgi:hypothetical protein